MRLLGVAEAKPGQGAGEDGRTQGHYCSEQAHITSQPYQVRRGAKTRIQRGDDRLQNTGSGASLEASPASPAASLSGPIPGHSGCFTQPSASTTASRCTSTSWRLGSLRGIARESTKPSGRAPTAIGEVALECYAHRGYNPVVGAPFATDPPPPQTVGAGAER